MSRFAIPIAVILSLLCTAAAFALTGDTATEDFFMPHAHCYLFNRSLMRLHGGSDLLIGLAKALREGAIVGLTRATP